MLKILVVEDNLEKQEQITEVILSTGLFNENIVLSTNVKDALENLRVNSFDILILDLKLPIRSSSLAPNDDGGKKILNRIRNRDVIAPKSGIVLTNYEGLKSDFLKDFTSFDIHIYDVTKSDEWISALQGKIQWQCNTNIETQPYERAKKRVIVTIHGINTAGSWQDLLEAELSTNKNVICKHYKYIHKAPFKIISPFWRRKIIKKFKEDLRGLFRNNPNCDFYFFAHSLGTYVLALTLKEFSSLNTPNIKLVTLSGSVLKREFDWETIRAELGIKHVINDCGINDWILPLAYFFAPGLGMAGRTGFVAFKNEFIFNRYFKGGHSFIEQSDNFYQEYWLPLISDETPKINMSENIEPGKVSELIIDSTKWLVYALIMLLIGLAFYLIVF